MCPTIRVDDEVYKWLQTQAVPFEDNPNSVLRRLAGFDRSQTQDGNDIIKTVAPSQGRRPPLARGKDLIRKWEINALQGRFRQDGKFYETPTKFPAALCDANGYIVFETEEDLRQSPEMQIGQKLNVRGGISAIQGYRAVRADLKVR